MNLTLQYDIRLITFKMSIPGDKCSALYRVTLFTFAQYVLIIFYNLNFNLWYVACLHTVCCIVCAIICVTLSPLTTGSTAIAASACCAVVYMSISTHNGV